MRYDFDMRFRLKTWLFSILLMGALDRYGRRNENFVLVTERRRP